MSRGHQIAHSNLILDSKDWMLSFILREQGSLHIVGHAEERQFYDPVVLKPPTICHKDCRNWMRPHASSFRLRASAYMEIGEMNG